MLQMQKRWLQTYFILFGHWDKTLQEEKLFNNSEVLLKLHLAFKKSHKFKVVLTEFYQKNCSALANETPRPSTGTRLDSITALYRLIRTTIFSHGSVQSSKVDQNYRCRTILRKKFTTSLWTCDQKVSLWSIQGLHHIHSRRVHEGTRISPIYL